MKHKEHGWVIANNNHPNGGNMGIFSQSFRYTRKECIRDFIEGSGSTWKHWRTKFNFICVKASSKIEIKK